MSGDDPSRKADYRGARIGAAATLTAVLVVLLLLDALRSDYELNQIVLFGLLGTILTMLGIEAGTIIRGK